MNPNPIPGEKRPPLEVVERTPREFYEVEDGKFMKLESIVRSPMDLGKARERLREGLEYATARLVAFDNACEQMDPDYRRHLRPGRGLSKRAR